MKPPEFKFKERQHETVPIDLNEMLENFRAYYAEKKPERMIPVVGMETAMFFDWYESLGRLKTFWYMVVLQIGTLGELRTYWKEHIKK